MYVCVVCMCVCVYVRARARVCVSDRTITNIKAIGIIPLLRKNRISHVQKVILIITGR